MTTKLLWFPFEQIKLPSARLRVLFVLFVCFFCGFVVFLLFGSCFWPNQIWMAPGSYNGTLLIEEI